MKGGKSAIIFSHHFVSLLDNAHGRLIRDAQNKLIAMVLSTMAIFLGGCGNSPHPTGASPSSNHLPGPTTQAALLPFYDADVDALCEPPAGWIAEPLESASDHTQQVWVSATGATAYGVIHFHLPLPFIGPDLALSGFLSHMKQSEGHANLIEEKKDSNLPGIRFVAEGGRYKIRASLIVKSWEGWTIFAGTLGGGPIISDELDFAERAREHTKIGRPDQSGN